MVFCINSVIQMVYFLYLSEVLQTNILHFPVQDYWGIKCNVYTEWVIFLKIFYHYHWPIFSVLIYVIFCITWQEKRMVRYNFLF